MANDSTVKAGSWGARTVEKIIRIIERAYSTGVPMVYLVDSAGARITDQVDLFPGRRGAGKIFHTQVRASGSIPQVCALFGPSAAGGAYIPAFCDLVVMVEGNASMYLGSDRMVEMVTGEKTTLEEMGGAKMHTTVSGVGHLLVGSDAAAIDAVRRYLSYFPSELTARPPVAAAGRTRQGRSAGAGPGIGAAGVRHAPLRQGPARRRTRSSRSTPAGPVRCWSASAGWTAGWSASSATTRCSAAACCSSTPPTRQRISSSSATRSTSRWSFWRTCPASWWAPWWSGRGSSGTARR